MAYYLGIDLGGTNVRVAKVDEEGRVSSLLEGKSYPQEPPEKTLAQIFTMVEQTPDYMACKGIGVGVPGPVDQMEGRMKMAINLPTFTNFPLGKRLEEKFKIPTFLENDANVAGLGEAVLGAGKGYPTVYYITVSTGVGGALIMNHQIISGQSGHAGEVNNIIVKSEGEAINGLNVGAIENQASGTAVTRKGKERIGEEILHAGIVFSLAQEGHPIALDILEQITEDLSVMMSAVSYTVDPHIFVFGGGMMKSQDIFFKKMKEKFYEKLYPAMRTVQVEPAKLKEPGVVGAAMLAMTKLQ